MAIKLKYSFRFGLIVSVISVLLNSFRFFDIDIYSYWQPSDWIVNGFARSVSNNLYEIMALSALFWFVVVFFLAMLLLSTKKVIGKDIHTSLDKYLKPEKKERKDREVKFCHECNAEIHIADKKCPECGAKQV